MAQWTRDELRAEIRKLERDGLLKNATKISKLKRELEARMAEAYPEKVR
jgi:hypothetical protein